MTVAEPALVRTGKSSIAGRGVSSGPDGCVIGDSSAANAEMRTTVIPEVEDRSASVAVRVLAVTAALLSVNLRASAWWRFFQNCFLVIFGSSGLKQSCGLFALNFLCWIKCESL